MVAHPGAGGNARVGQLHRAAQPVDGAGGQGVHGDDAGGADVLTHRPGHLAALHPRVAQHLRRQRGHRPEGTEVLGHLPHQVPGDQSTLVDLGADGVGGDGPVSKPHHQHQAVGGHPLQKAGELSRHRPGRPAEDVLLPPGHSVQGEGHIVPPGLAQGLLALLVQNAHRGYRDSLPVSLLRRHPGQAGGLPRPLLPQLPGLHRQVCSPDFHDGSPFRPAISCGQSPWFPLFLARGKKLSQSLRFFQKNS